MLGVTFFGLIFTPVFYVVCRWLGSSPAPRWVGQIRHRTHLVLQAKPFRIAA